jgi:hypothetical protein
MRQWLDRILWLPTPALAIILAVLLAAICVTLLVLAERRHDARRRAVASRLTCPACGKRPLSFHGECWVALSNPGPSSQGPIYHCSNCAGDFEYSDKGDLASNQ